MPQRSRAAIISVMVCALTVTAPATAGLGEEVESKASKHALRELPAGFSDTVVANVPAPTALAWTPDGRMLVTSRPGRVLVMDEDHAAQITALDIRSAVCDQGEQGLLGIAVDPRFERNQFVYLYWTHKVRAGCESADPPQRNRVTRFELGPNGTVVPGSHIVIVDHIVSPSGQHVGGDLEFGDDGFLYVSVGDGLCSLTGTRRCGPLNDNAQLRRIPHGKILRVRRDGRPAAGNPYADAKGSRWCTRPAGVPAGAGPCKEIFATGLRNPFRMARQPGTNTFYVNDVGMHIWEEVNLLGRGRNYGWNEREGHCVRDSRTRCGRTRFTNPIHDYVHRGGCRSITGGAFVPKGLWPGFDGAYLYADFACGTVFRLGRTQDGGFQRTRFLTGARGPTHLRFGPHQDGTALYYLSYFRNTVRRVAMAGANTPPVADFAYTPNGREVAFDGSASYDPDAGDRITSWSWTFGDGTTQTTSSPRVTHTYAAEGDFVASLTVTDQHDLVSSPASLTVASGEHPPSVDITAPEPTAQFAVGETVRLTAHANDAEDGELAGSSLSWHVRLRHGNHSHPLIGPEPGRTLALAYPEPEDLEAAQTSTLVAQVSATDSRGLRATQRQELSPHRVRLTFRTSPQHGKLVLQGQRETTPYRTESWAGYRFPVHAPDQSFDGKPYTWRSWSDGGARRHDIVTPDVATEYLARFRRP
jgi:glucose/arabinose dehydrogenase/PKD repeat protein